ncbi:hypothetical protein IEQ34_000858 [Dendrobium chrysotoxum]|uniref:Uncharacterized protein n=1 Tax=Dendrobium chrysotoxum TaxID=161865 RepID=A0AAV7HA61_DENCH|nr:hypothetical protein IEQ34_000858 [Dendrobium chrysotoxum]
MANETRPSVACILVELDIKKYLNSVWLDHKKYAIFRSRIRRYERYITSEDENIILLKGYLVQVQVFDVLVFIFGNLKERALKGRVERVEFEREKILVGFEGEWRGFHKVPPVSLHLTTIIIKGFLKESFGKKKISLVSKDPATPSHQGR